MGKLQQFYSVIIVIITIVFVMTLDLFCRVIFSLHKDRKLQIDAEV